MKLALEDCEIDLDKRTVARGDQHKRLTATEVGLLRYLATHPHEVVSREELYREVWEHQADLLTRTLDLAVFRLRKKIEKDPSNPDHVMTVYGRGYTFVPKNEDAQLLPAPAPAAARRATTRTNIGREENHFFGREDEQRTLTELMETRSGFITVLGPPGTGKTRLTKHWAAEHMASGAVSSAWFCDLTEARTEEGVIQAIASALGVSLTTREEGVEALAKMVGDAINRLASTVVVLDNAEQVIEWVGPLVETWWKQATQARFVVTSQVATGVSMEQRMPLSPLPMPSDEAAEDSCPSVQLFVDRARSVQPGFEQTPDNQADIAAIVTALDGLPLAIELAAARIHLMTPATLRTRLADRFRLLKRPKPAGPARHQTLQAALDWSWELLEPWEQAALAQCSVFHGGFDWEGVEAVVDLSAWPEAPWSVDVLAELIERSLVMVQEDDDGVGRLSMLTSVTEYAKTRRSEMPEPSVKDAGLRHARHFAQLGTPENIKALTRRGGIIKRWRMNKELENLLAGVEQALDAEDENLATSCALAATEIFLAKGPFSDAISMLQRVVELGTQPHLRGLLLGKTAWLMHLSGRAEEAWATNQSALEVAQESDDRNNEALSRDLLGHLSQRQGRLSEAADHYQQALAIAVEVGNRHIESLSLGNLADTYREMGQWNEAMVLYQKALKIHLERGNRRTEGIVTGNLAILYRNQGNISEARAHYKQAIDIHREVGNRPFVGLALGNLGYLEVTQGNLSVAQEHFQQALEIHREVGSRMLEGSTLGNLASLTHLQGDLEAAQELYEKAIAICENTSPRTYGLFLSGLARVRAEQGAFDQARALMTKSKTQMPSEHAIDMGFLLCTQARVEFLAGDSAAAKRAFLKAEVIADEHKARPDSELGKAIIELRETLSD